MRRLVLSFLFLGLTLSTAAGAQSIPPIKAKTLADTDIVLPQPGGTRIVILVLGFSHKGGEKRAPWGKRLSSISSQRLTSLIINSPSSKAPLRLSAP